MKILLLLLALAATTSSGQTLLEKLDQFEAAAQLELEVKVEAKRREVIAALKEKVDRAMSDKDLDEAIRLKGEIIKLELRISNTVPITPSKIAALDGYWQFRYSNGVRRDYEFNKTKSFTAHFGKGKTSKGKLSQKNGAITTSLDASPTQIERLTILGDRILIENWVTKSLYPNSLPNTIAIGVLRKDDK